MIGCSEGNSCVGNFFDEPVRTPQPSRPRQLGLAPSRSRLRTPCAFILREAGGQTVNPSKFEVERPKLVSALTPPRDACESPPPCEAARLSLVCSWPWPRPW